MIDEETKTSINYVESRFLKSELDDSSYVEKLINEIKETNLKVAQEVRERINKESTSNLRLQNAIVQKTDLWIEEMEEKLRNLD